MAEVGGEQQRVRPRPRRRDDMMNARSMITTLVIAVLVALPVLWSPTPAAAQTGTNERWLEQLYRDVLGRAPDPAGRTLFMRLLNTGASPGQVGATLLSGQEYRTRLLQSIYQEYLHRAAEPAELPFFLDVLNAGGGAHYVVEVILGCDEYFRQSGGTNAAWVIQIYGDLLGREPSRGDLTRWTSLLDNEGSREDVAARLLDGREYRTSLIHDYFQAYLNRPARSDELASFVERKKSSSASLSWRAASTRRISCMTGLVSGYSRYCA
jgi:hypothetical protein